MKTIISLALLGLALIGRAEATTLPWMALSDLKRNIAGASAFSGCGDARPMGAFVITNGSDTYFLIVNADSRWVIIGPVDPDGKTPIWYGTVVQEDRLLIERTLVGAPETDVCPFLREYSA